MTFAVISIKEGSQRQREKQPKTGPATLNLDWESTGNVSEQLVDLSTSKRHCLRLTFVCNLAFQAFACLFIASVVNERWSSKWSTVTNSEIVSFLITNSVVWKGDLHSVVYSAGRHYFQHVAVINFCPFSMYFWSNRAESWKQIHDYDTSKWFIG